jgi:hypothetical protein
LAVDEFSPPRESLLQMEPPPRRTIVCDLGAFEACPDVATIDVLARLQLTLRPHGVEILLSGAPEELLELIAFAGLADVLRVEPRRQAEQRKQGAGVEEERELDDFAS